MLSNGGISSTAIAQKIPIQLIESGPAAGALAAARYADLLGIDQVLAFDIGGTTAKLCCIENGQPFRANTFETARARRFKRGSGLPLLIPVIELIEIGAGGGSIAHVDDLGLLKVGPESAGAEPGPACYGRGGDRPTVTDADVVCGFLNPDYFLGGKQMSWWSVGFSIVASETSTLTFISIPGLAFKEAMSEKTLRLISTGGDRAKAQPLIDATRPLRWRDQFPPINQFSRARASVIRRKWGLE